MHDLSLLRLYQVWIIHRVIPPGSTHNKAKPGPTDLALLFPLKSGKEYAVSTVQIPNSPLLTFFSLLSTELMAGGRGFEPQLRLKNSKNLSILQTKHFHGVQEVFIESPLGIWTCIVYHKINKMCYRKSWKRSPEAPPIGSEADCNFFYRKRDVN